jgi:leucine-zipper of insertion element IS481
MNIYQNARLTQFRRRQLVTRLERGESVISGARELGISVRTARKWRERVRVHGGPGLHDRFRRPTRLGLPTRRPNGRGCFPAGSSTTIAAFPMLASLGCLR